MENYETGEIVDTLISNYKNDEHIEEIEFNSQPDVDVIHEITRKLLRIVFPGYFREKNFKFYNLSSYINSLIEDVVYNLEKQIYLALQQCPECLDKNGVVGVTVKEKTEYVIRTFLQRLLVVREYLATDVKAAFDGDPAAFNKNEIILAYPGIWAIAINRIAHELYNLNVPLIPRIMTEYAHSKTGIDIHPGVTIGKYFFIDHGTGVVIGETAVIGEHVKIYQGVTLGALSTRAGQMLKGQKRHPTIEDYVTIYSGASILGGNTVIGKNAVIGGNAFITTSIDADAKVSIKNQELDIKTGTKKEVVQDENWFYII
ncbi:serine O-acetyltransferase EpsC [Treponema zioleckii]|uniref:serine O-acetyltransferase EpsC n=1 Tax=Treponema zioleckii TaxID=331680 RepID=UPI00168B8E49|nr:serine O-acetyltransferase EpsC [Treponema zioleckii]